VHANRQAVESSQPLLGRWIWITRPIGISTQQQPDVLRVNCGERASLQRFYLLATCWTRWLGDEPSGNTVAG